MPPNDDITYCPAGNPTSCYVYLVSLAACTLGCLPGIDCRS